eukprot:1753985-Rhodomonas_salina.1
MPEDSQTAHLHTQHTHTHRCPVRCEIKSDATRARYSLCQARAVLHLISPPRVPEDAMQA